MKRITTTIAILAAMAGTAATSHAAISPDSIAARMERQLLEYPQEAIHVTTDQGVYLAGDTVWMRPFVVDAATLKQVDASRYVYVEFSAPTGDVVKRVKLLKRDGKFSGYIPLPIDLPEGSYTLSAYTMFMRNQGPEFFFRKPLRVLSPYALREGFDVRLKSDSGNPRLIVDRKSTQADMTLKIGDKEKTVRGSDAHLEVGLSRKDAAAGPILVTNGQYSRYVTVPPADTTLAVTLHPEGGYLIPGIPCKVGVKAIGVDGLGRDISGTVTDSRGKAVCDFSTLHAGMGTFTLTPKADEKYTLKVGGNSYPLPEADSRAAVIHVAGTDHDGGELTASAVGNVPSGAMLVVQTRGILKGVSAITPESPVRIPRERLGEGVSQLLLIDADGNTLSERLVWNAPER
ncbi:MG2 domain-containing protein [uncultured Muribaculum sp.]|uniref:MG2 domain-containing protein n=1 Tax=uncultured Muribaculum sp. TaxID=1918613 RepID=UPI0025F141C2|nr:MG2 domain-containing protein [uncultured Muribaculum sp.]